MRRSKVYKLAPTVTESPQLQQSFCALASEDLQCKAGPKVQTGKSLLLQKNKFQYQIICLIQ